MTALPITDEEFAAALRPLLEGLPEGPLALAVSGGRDSMALMHLAARYARPRGPALTVLTVNHDLRSNSATEANSVGAAAQALGLPHKTLVWQHPANLRGNLEAVAREARYRLMAEACIEAGAAALLVAHTQDDQAETVLLRLARGSGVDGLSAMAPKTRRFGLPILRPLLDVPRARLEARLRAEGIAWFDDPMNEEERFARVRIRKAQAVLVAAGLTPARLAQTARHMARARAALDDRVDALACRAALLAAEGYVRLDLADLRAAPEEIGLRLLARLIMVIGGLVYPPRFERLERLYRLLTAGDFGKGRTLGGCRILPSGTAQALILREAAGLGPPLPLTSGRPMLWDGRFLVQGTEGIVRALGPDGILALRRAGPGTSWAQIPAPVRPTLPSLWIADSLAAIPHLNYAAPAHGKGACAFAARFTALC